MRSIEDILSEIPRCSDSRQRLELKTAFLDAWYGVRPSHSLSTSLPGRIVDLLPPALLFLYRTAQQHLSITRLVPAKSLSAGEFPLQFCLEEQGVYSWALAEDGPDPRILGRWEDRPDEWTPEAERLSWFALQLLLINAAIASEVGASASYCSANEMADLVEGWSFLPLGHWRWPSYPNRFLVRGNALGLVTPNHEGFTLHFAAPTASGLEFLLPKISEAFEWRGI